MRPSLFISLAGVLFLAGCSQGNTDIVGSVGTMIKNNSGTLQNLQKTAQDTMEYTKQGIEQGKKTVSELQAKAALIESGVMKLQQGMGDVEKALGR